MACLRSIIAALLLAVSVSPVTAVDWVSPEYKWLYQFPLPMPPLKQPKMAVTDPVTHQPIDFYEISIRPLTQQIYPDRGPTYLVGYDGMPVGPTFIVPRDRQTVVRFTNNNTLPSEVHLHGSPSRAPWDGWSGGHIQMGQYKDYYYPNNQSGRFLWYHDHRDMITSVNVYYGQAGPYILHDPAEDSLNLPSTYGVNDIPLILASKQYNDNGTLFSPANMNASLFGDIVHVNGQPWPFFDVEPRKYRLRLLNGALSRSFRLYFEQQCDIREVPFQVVASDSGLLSHPVTTSDLYLSPGERYDVVFDFSSFAGHNVTLRNFRHVGKSVDYLHTDQVMRFVVGQKPVQDTTKVPSTLRNVPLQGRKDVPDRTFTFSRATGEWSINGVVFSGAKDRVLAKPEVDTVEIWELINGDADATHPVHIHLVDFRVLSRTGPRGVMPYESSGLKDVVWLDAGEAATVEAYYGPYDGEYIFHCHDLVHEDHEMMDAFNITKPGEDGTDANEPFYDPMALIWGPRPAVAADYTTEAITKKIQLMASMKPYDDDNTTGEDVAARSAEWARRMEDHLDVANASRRRRRLH